MKTNTYVIALLLLAACDGGGQQARVTYTDKDKCGGTVEPWNPPQSGIAEQSLVSTHIRLTNKGRILWNGSPINDKMLAYYFTESASMAVTPWIEVVVEEGTPCDLVKSLRSLAVERGACVNGCEEYSERDWAVRNPPPPEE